MKTLTINLPDNLDIDQERQLLALTWYKSGKLTAMRAADVAGTSSAVFLAMTEPPVATDQLLKKMARPISADFDREALERTGRARKLDWHKLDQLADQVAIDSDAKDLLTQIGK